ncbi:MAG: hypothetical protein ACI9TK_000407 [Flavobacteriaceae bacterium]|jgi:hypothetical protein|tara:strand:+ start:8517 stop:9194 length:678 start_codon:yes stop_codon:yes gene_type:complete
MTEQIKNALVKWAERVLESHEKWDASETHEALQKLYEISIYHKMTEGNDLIKSQAWAQQEIQLKSVIDSLSGVSASHAKNVEEKNLEAPSVMDTIKEMVTEMPEKESYEKLFDTVSDPPTFVVKDENTVPQSVSETLEEERENINDLFSKTISIDLNDRLSFIKHLFDDDNTSYERVLSQVVTYQSWEEVTRFLNQMVKPEYNNWKDKQVMEERFLTILQNNFTA